MSVPAIELRRLTKKYGGLTAVRDLDLSVPAGATYALLGPNGAGKTTVIRIILRIIEETTGDVRVLGRPVDRSVLDRIGYLPEERGVYKKMTVRRLLSFLAELKGVSPRTSRPRIDQWLERLELSDRRDARVEELSKGMQQKIQFIGTILHEPEIVILDEPFSGLDPINQRILREIIDELRQQGRTILFSTHIIEHAERLCDHVCIIARGARQVDGPLARVKEEHGERHVALLVDDGVDPRPALERSAGVAGSRPEGGQSGTGSGRFLARLRDGASPSDLLEELVRAGVRIRSFELVEPSLEQIFIDRAAPAAEADPLEEEVVHV